MDLEELKALLQKATEKFEAQDGENQRLGTEIKSLTDKIEELQQQEHVDVKTIDELRDEISDLRSKMKSPILAITDEDQKKALRDLARKSYNSFIKDAKATNVVQFKNFGAAIEAEVKTLNIGTGGSGTAAAAIAEILSMDLIEYAREYSPILNEIAMRNGLTRDYRELVLESYPAIADGIEGVPGSDFAATATQTYGEVKADVIKLMANAPITDEAFYGTTYNVYSDLVRLLGDQLAVTFAAKVMFGNGADKNGRGILSSSRVDITDVTGESWKPSMGASARDHDYFPVISTGVDGALGADDQAVIDFVEDVIATLPTKYLAGAGWKMNRKTRAVFAKIRGADLQPVFKRNYIEGGVDTIAGFPVLLDDTMPDIASNSTPIIFGDLSKAFAMSNGDISYMQLNPYKTQGVTYVEHNHEVFTIMQHSDAILVVACTVNDANP
jgi:HK97 family phage major capsid protein